MEYINLSLTLVEDNLSELGTNTFPLEMQLSTQFSPPSCFKPYTNVVNRSRDIKKRWQEYTEELYKKDLHHPDNHDGVITHLEPDILECEIKWALGSITTNKASGGDGIPVELFQILKHDAVKMLQSICQQIWKTEQWP